MEPSEVATQNETVDNKTLRVREDGQNTEATGDVSSQGAQPVSVCKMSEETDARYNRLKLFDKVMQKSLEKFIELARYTTLILLLEAAFTYSFNRFSTVFRPLYKKNPQRMENIHKQFIEELRRTIQDDLSRLVEEGRLDFKLNELDKLEQAATNNPNPAWRPSGVPEQDFCSFLMPYYQKQEAYMRLELKKIQAENAALAQKVQAGRENIAQTEHRISTTVDEWKASVTDFERLASSLCPADVFDV